MGERRWEVEGNLVKGAVRLIPRPERGTMGLGRLKECKVGDGVEPRKIERQQPEP